MHLWSSNFQWATLMIALLAPKIVPRGYLGRALLNVLGIEDGLQLVEWD